MLRTLMSVLCLAVLAGAVGAQPLTVPGIGVLPLGATRPASGPAKAIAVKAGRSTDLIMQYDVLELSFVCDEGYARPHFDVDIDVAFTSPAGKPVKVGGFLYGSTEQPKVVREEPAQPGGRPTTRRVFERPNVWKARLAPMESGAWKYRWTFTDSRNGTAGGEGAFEVVKGRKPLPGFVRQNPDHPFRWVLDNGQPYWPLGFQDGWGDAAGLGTVLSSAGMEGPFRTDRRFDLPEGPMFVRGPSMNPQNADVQFRAFSQAGFNLFRFSQKNASFAIEKNLDELLLPECQNCDELLARVRTYGFRTMYGLFGNQRILEGPPLPDNLPAVETVLRFVRYSVNRWGAYVDFWQILNEKLAHDEWIDIIVAQIRAIDPYGHPITTSWQRPDHKLIEINAPHWYHRVDTADDSDLVVAERAKLYKRFGKPVIVGEHGNNVTVLKRAGYPIPYESDQYEAEDVPRLRQEGKLPPGAGGTWNPDSALRMRVRNWTALCTEISFIYWNTSYARDGHTWNMWFGPRERTYCKAMQDFAALLDRDMKMAPVQLSDPGVRGYALVGTTKAAVYLWRFADQNKPKPTTKPAVDARLTASVTLEGPKVETAFGATYYRPSDGAVLGGIMVNKGKRMTLRLPAFDEDLALLIAPSDKMPLLDSDHDGKPNDEDDDDDNDGVPDAKDPFPLDPSEWSDKDGDLIGDNLDADADGDGVADDLNKNGTPDFEEMDFDGDGVPRAKAVPFDAFPRDPKESRDTDGDGIGDNADSDDDNDGFTDEDEKKAGTDPLRRDSFPKEQGG